MTASIATSTQNPQANTTPPNFSLWRVQGTFTLQTPLSMGTGQDEPLHDADQDNWVGCVARDHRDEPYLSGSGIKGALRALARRTDLPAEVTDRLFGSVQGEQTSPAQLEICNAYLRQGTTASSLPGFDAQPHSALLMHSVRNRDYGTVEDGLLFTEQAVPAGYQFAFECSAQNLQESDIAHLLGLLQLAGATQSSFQLGGRQASDNGRITWQLGQVNRLNDLRALWQAVQSRPQAAIDLWASAAKPHVHAKVLTQNSGELLLLPDLVLKFHTPFLVYQANKAKQNVGDPDGVPRRNSAGQPVLPASSLHGALRSQAERILRTLGEETPAGYKVPAVFGLDKVARLDLASLLFGASGWRAVVQCSDFLAPKDAPLLKHDMVAIDRITGGGKDSAKFCIQALDCPTLRGSIRIDLGRLRKLELHNPQLVVQVLGLLTHVLRDLDEGDIALGYGRAKGYGISLSQTLAALQSALQSQQPPLEIDATLQAFATRMTAFNPATGAELHAPTATKVPPALEPTTPSGDFHNPYVFLPTSAPDVKNMRLPWVQHMDIRSGTHSHGAYHASALHGRLLCKLTTQTPLFIGAGEDSTQQPKIKQNFTLRYLNLHSQNIALPSTSLRGMLSSLHESISQSALRVMHERSYSVRASTNEPLQYRGTVKQETRNIGGKDRIVYVLEERESGKSYVIPPAPLNRLYAITDERTEDAAKHDTVLPEVKPRGVARNPDSAQYGNKARLCMGQTMYFNLDADGKKITELAYSQIWRKAVQKDGKPWTTSHALPSLDLSPLNGERPLSPSELLFGIVQDMGDAYEKSTTAYKAANPAKAFASKVRFGYGIALKPVVTEAAVTLKILASPKPPSPAMYFKKRDGETAYISKAMLSNAPDKYVLQGRKAYLHGLRDASGQICKLANDGKAAPAGQGTAPWQSIDAAKDAKQKVCVTPIAQGQDFYFEVDFANLSQAELESLCATLQPTANYEHKLGMGKPIGLGSVKINVIGLFLVNRQQRYLQTKLQPSEQVRYAAQWRAEHFPQQLPAYFATEQQACAIQPLVASPWQLSQSQMNTVYQKDTALWRAITLAGNPGAVKLPVHYPQVARQPIETEAYQWFVENDRVNATHQHLKPFTSESKNIPALRRNP
ncbi:MAG: TIGR03986 family CRISPR-associated RAMP protein [Rhodoferax sp.]|nr:TIGR03986 family CRISPR-associated RAMP protein [Rhodoferax sp.]